MSAPAEIVPELHDRLTRLLAEVGALATATEPGGPLMVAVAEEVARGRTTALREDTRQLADVVERLRAHCRELVERAQRPEPPSTAAEPQTASIAEVLGAAAGQSAEALRSTWLRLFATELEAWRLDACERLTREAPGTGVLDDLQRTFAACVAALRTGDLPAALPGLGLLVDDHPAGLPTSPLDPALRTACLVLLGRAELEASGPSADVLARFERAHAAAPQDGRVHAGLAEYHGAAGDDTSARDLARQAISLAPDLPDGYVDLALACERQKWWDEALDWYGQAVELALRRADGGDPSHGFGRLLAPVSGTLHLCLARRLAKENPGLALSAVDRALELGLAGPEKYPDRPARELRAQVLEALGRPTEAAQELFLAGQSLFWEEQHDAARRAYERVAALDPQHVANHWAWAETLRFQAFVPRAPWVDPPMLARSLDVWNRGIRLALPDRDSAWTYVTRARIAQQLAAVPGEDRWERSWEAVAFVEQELLLDPGFLQSWVMLAQLHYALGNDQSALRATENALLLEPDDAGVVEERVILLTNLDRLADARLVLDRRRRLSPAAPDFVAGIDAHLELYGIPRSAGPEAYRAALASSTASLAAGANAPWVRIDRAQLLRLMDLREEARQEYEEVWRHHDSQDVGNTLVYAWAALMTGRYPEAEEVTRRRLGDRVSGLGGVERYLGFCALLRGDASSARDHLRRAVSAAGTRRDLEVWLINDLEADSVRERLATGPGAAEARAVLNEAQAAARARHATLPAPFTALEEMRGVVAELARRGDRGWALLAARATVARLALEAGRWAEAEESFRLVQAHPLPFHGVPLGLAEAALLGGAGAPGTHEVPSPELHAAALKVHEQREQTERRRPFLRFGDAGMQRNVGVTPIGIQGAADLRSLLQAPEGGLDPALARLLQDVRQEIEHGLGFTVPPVTVQVNELELLHGTYLFLLHEVPLVSGDLRPNRRLCGATVEELASRGVRGEGVVHPATGDPCAWVDPSDVPRVREAGFTVWSPVECLVLHLGAVLRANAATLVGLQDVANLVQARAPEHHDAIVAAAGGFARFSSVVEALLGEQVSIVPLPSLCQRYLELQGVPAYEIPEELRCLDSMRTLLPGNAPGTPVWRLGPRLLSTLSDGILRQGEAAVLALEPEPTQAILTAVRDHVTSRPPSSRAPAILVEDWRARPFVRALVELEFPFLPIVSRREAIEPDGRPDLGTIELGA